MAPSDFPAATSQDYGLPASYQAVEAEYWALRQGAGWCDLSRRTRLLVTGDDSPRFVHGMVTSDVLSLAVGRGSHTFFLNVQGHVLAQANLFRLGETRILLDSEPQSSEVIADALNRHIIMDMVEVVDLRAEYSCLALEGPQASELLKVAVSQRPTGRVGHESTQGPLEIEELPEMDGWLLRASYTGLGGIWLIARTERVAASKALLQKSAQGMQVGFEALESNRIESGIPRFGVDITEKNLLQETGQMNAVSFNKGCYIGQEVVERVRSRGHVNRTLVRLRAVGRYQPIVGTEIHVLDRAVGYAGSSGYSFAEECTFAFGYLRSELAVADTQVECEGVSYKVETLPKEKSL